MYAQNVHFLNPMHVSRIGEMDFLYRVYLLVTLPHLNVRTLWRFGVGRFKSRSACTLKCTMLTIITMSWIINEKEANVVFERYVIDSYTETTTYTKCSIRTLYY